jgi:hypothetical protein
VNPEQLKGSLFPENGSPQERADWHLANASPEEKLAIAAHELGHYEMAKRAGVDPEGITIGHHPKDDRSASVLFSGEDLDTGLTHYIDQWQEKRKLIREADSKQFFTSYFKTLYAGEAAEDIITERVSNSGEVDSKEARRVMMGVGMFDFTILSTERELKDCVRKELNEAETRRKLTYAARQLAKHHFDGRKHPASTIDHYLNAGRENLPKEGQ